jgi:hypothetical protein
MFRNTVARAVAAAATLSVILVLGAMAPAAAEPSGARAKPAGPVSTLGVGWHNEVAVPRTLYQCPSTVCNQGQAYPGNDLAEVCTFYNGITWGLVFNRANLHTGFIPIAQLKYADPPQSCTSVGIGHHWIMQSTLYQCPAFICNQGQANPGDDVAVICVFADSGNQRWTWAVNHANYHEGFILHDQDPSAPNC